MIVENPFPSDIRVKKEAYSLKDDYKITVIALKKKSEKYFENYDDITIYRIPEFPDFNLGKIRYILQYFYFTICASIIFIGTFPKNRYRVIHVHNPPDTLFIVGLIGKLFRSKFIYDHHDLSPELYLTRFSGKKDIVYKTLILCEKVSCKLADVIISTNESYKQIEINRHNIDSSKIYVVRNNPIISDCLLKNNGNNELKKENNKKVLLFLGSINPQDGLDTLLIILHYLVYDMSTKDVICNIVGDGDSLQTAKQMAAELELSNYVDFKGLISNREEIKEFLNSADVCVEPAPDNALNRHSTFVKLMEYMAAAKPVVAFDLKESRYSTNGTAILVPLGDIEGFAQAIKKLLDEPQLRKDLGNASLDRIKKELHWENSSINLMKAYQTLNISIRM